MNLLYITAGKTSHYIFVIDMNRMVLRQHNNDCHKYHFCQYCLHGCTSEEVLKNVESCKLHVAQKIKLPEADNKKGYKKKWINTVHRLRLPFVIYADFKSVLRKQDLLEPSSSKSFTSQYQLHLREMQWRAILLTTPSEYEVWRC